VEMVDPEVNAMLLEGTNDTRIKVLHEKKKYEVQNFDAFITIVYTTNDYENKEVNAEIQKKIGEAVKEEADIRTNERKWVLLNYPSPLDAYKAGMPTKKYQNFAFDVMNVDYPKMAQDIEPLKHLMEKTDKVRITGKDTDITFSIKGIPVIPCTGEKNIPDGEIYSAPIKDSVNGYITYNTPSPYRGNIYHHVKLTFQDGKIIEATCDEDNEALNKIFDSDEGARYVGEFSLGLNPMIKDPMGDILYDEKIIGSIHFTPGRCYRDADNGNESTIHWDMVLIQRPEYGGGDIYFDDQLIRKDGQFVLEELKHLNYDEKR